MFVLNGRLVTTSQDISLLKYLREVENITSAKDGCSEGACGTCMVLIDKKAVKACIFKTSKLVGKEILTIEGFTDREKEVFSYCFGKMGAVQCGFCIPGMVISARALFYKTLTPTKLEVKQAIKNNICRCTGYIKIEEAILLCAKMFNENIEVPNENYKGLVGEDIIRVDAKQKVLGDAKYTDDLRFDNMVYGKALRTKYPRAKILSIDTSKAKAHKQCLGVFTATDITGKNYIGHLVKDWPAMIPVGEITRYLGDSLALVAVTKEEFLDEVLGLIEVSYEPLKPLTSPTEAMNDDGIPIHPTGNILKKEVLKRGNPDEELKNAKHVLTYNFSTPFTEHAFLEPECAIAMPDGDGVLLYTGGQSIFDEKREVSELLGIDQVKVISANVGGGFGGKEDMSVQHHAAFLAYKIKRTVKVTLSRTESILIHPKRHAADMEFTVGCDENGILKALRATIVTDTGAYASLGGPVLQRACTHAGGPYNYQSIDITGIAVYTNNPPAGAFRGFGVTQSCFAFESILNKLAELVNISPWEIRYRNAIRPGQVLPNGQIVDHNTALVEALEAVKDVYHNNKNVGIACAMKNAGLGVGIPDTSRVTLSVSDSKVHIRCSAADIGQGIAQVLVQMLCQTTGLTPSDVIVEPPNTSRMLDAGTTTASRQTLLSGEACIRASKKLKADLDIKKLSDLEGKEYFDQYVTETDPMGSPKANPVSHVGYGYAAQVVVLDDEGKVTKVVAAHDVGTIVNPKACEGQVEGGVVMCLGYGLTEDYPLVECMPQAKFGTLGLFKSTMTPEIETILLGNGKETDFAYGAKGVGEIAAIPAAPAVQGAYYKLDGKFRTKLPLENTFYKS